MEMSSEAAMVAISEGFTAAATQKEKDGWRYAFIMGMTGFLHRHTGQELDPNNPEHVAYLALRQDSRSQLEAYMKDHPELTPLEHLLHGVGIVRTCYEAAVEAHPGFVHELGVVRALEEWVATEPLVDQAFATDALQRAGLYPYPVG